MPRKTAKKSAPRRRPLRRVARRRFVKPARSSPNTAKVVEFFDLGVFNCNEAYEFGLAGIVPANGGQPTRCATIAPAYGLYRVAQVEYKITPKYDTYTPNLGQAGAPVGNQIVEIPKLYWKMNRYGDAPVGFTHFDMLSLGSKPIRLDDKTITIKYKPNILLANAGAVAAGQNGGSGQVKLTPWLSTDTEADDNAFALSTTQHYGHIMYIESAAAGTGITAACEISARVIYEFKNPRILESSHAASERALTPHVRQDMTTRTVVQAAGSRPLDWNLQNTAS